MFKSDPLGTLKLYNRKSVLCTLLFQHVCLAVDDYYDFDVVLTLDSPLLLCTTMLGLYEIALQFLCSFTKYLIQKFYQKKKLW